MAAPHSSAAAAVAKQVTQSNFAAAVRELRAHLDACDFVSVAAQKTGAPVGWRRVLPVDTAETAYLKAKLAAESFQPLHLAVCPFRFLPSASNILAFPYNFHLFPRDELNLGMPSYSFSCQSSYLSSMAQDGFDFNMCIYDGISYLSRVQESLARQKILISPRICQLSPSPATTVADSVFMGRVKLRIEHWRKGCVEPSKTADGSLVSSLRKLILGDESYASRPSMSISICSDRQVQLVLEAVNRIGDDLLPLVVPDKAGAARAVRVIFTSSKEDKNLLMMEIKKLEDEQNLRFRGFREVIDLLSASQKPIISYNCLNDFTMIHSKFVAPLPPNLHEFMCSLRMVFSNFIDVGHLWREIGPLRKAQNISAALSYLQRQFFVPIEMEIPLQDDTCSVTKSGKNILRITKLFAKLSNLLKISPDCRSQPDEQCRTIEDYSNVLYPSYKAQESDDVDCTYESDATRKISTENIVFLWGFSETSDKELRCRLRSSHEVFSKDFELKLLDKACSALIFHSSDSARELLREISVESPALTNFFSEGMKAAGFDAYRKVCKLGLWDLHLADALDSVSSEPSISPTHSGHGTSEMCWNGDMMLDLKEYLES